MRRPFSSDEVRAEFLEFFEKHDHARIEGSSLIPVNDPTLLFINSGMAPLKPYFTGMQQPPHPRLCNVQPCVRTTDIEDVGDRHHLTFFEMLGSWSIGDYFKQRAVELAYELLVDRFGLEPDRLYVTVFAGDPKLGLPPDEEVVAHWEGVGVPHERIVPLGMDDNFWGPAGDTGPCGPCTEVFYDSGLTYGEAYRPGGPFDTTRRYIEIWNAGVFMQFDKKADGSYEPLPFFSVDTGSGLERLTMALNELPTVYETDLFTPTLSLVQELLDETGEVRLHHRLLTDHLRAATFILGDGVAFSNEGRGYIPRRLIRKAMAVARRAGSADFDFAAVVDSVIARMAEHYPQLAERRDDILRLLDEERREFGRAMQRGLERLEELQEADGGISGKDAFHLFSTYGLPFEITRDLAAESGAEVDEAGFHEEFRHHQELSRAGGGHAVRPGLSDSDPLPDLPAPGLDQFVGYDALTVEAALMAMFVDGEQRDCAEPGEHVELLAATTPFYAEGGGQVGDRGVVGTDNGVVDVTDTVKHASGYHVHRGIVRSGEVHAGQVARLQVDADARAASQANHSATHILNAGLRRVLGEHVRQTGSLVAPDRLRFDFSHPAPLTPAQVEEVERLVNEQIFADHRRDVQVLPPSEAVASGALYLPGEEYGSAVRVVSFDGFSREFCGGTHVHATGEIGLFRIVSEQAVAAGMRRITAVTRSAALDVTLQREQVLNELTARLRTNISNLPNRVGQLLLAAREGGKEPARADVDLAMLQPRQTTAGVAVAAARVPSEVATRPGAMAAARRLGAVVCLVGSDGETARVVVAVPRELAALVDSRRVLDGLLPEIDGKGGGTRELAQGGGRRVGGLDNLLMQVPGAVDLAVTRT